MECVLLRLLRSPRRHYAERRGEKERRTDNHLRRETEQDREKVAEAEASSSFSLPLSTSCLLLTPFHGPKRREGEEGEWGALFLPSSYSHAIPIPPLLFSCSQGTCLTFPNSGSTFFPSTTRAREKIFQSPTCLFFPSQRKIRAGRSDIFAHPFRHKCRYRAKLGLSSYLS